MRRCYYSLHFRSHVFVLDANLINRILLFNMQLLKVPIPFWVVLGFFELYKNIGISKIEIAKFRNCEICGPNQTSSNDYKVLI